MKSHVTQDEAFKALCNKDVPIIDSLKLFKKAYRRSNEATKAFVLIIAGNIRDYSSNKSGGAE